MTVNGQPFILLFIHLLIQINSIQRHLHSFIFCPYLFYSDVSFIVFNQFIHLQTLYGWFNKGVLFNAGFLEIEKRFPGYFTCLILQDVDILPENDNILYRCTENATHLSTYIDRYKYK